MSTDWENSFRGWAKPLSDTAQAKCENAERMIRDAVRENASLAGRSIQVFPQGSYRNNTNIRYESDVDICVLCTDTFFYDFDFASGLGRGDVPIDAATYSFGQFKNELHQALVDKFGTLSIARGKKAFDVHANSYRLDADVVPCFEHRRYLYRQANGQFYYETGTEFEVDNGGRIINWPQQHYDNGVAKNDATGRRFKAVVRVLKNLSCKMADDQVRSAPLPSFLIECLVWNAPAVHFLNDSYLENVRQALVHLYQHTKDEQSCKEWVEINDRKFLFHPSQAWTRQQANDFVVAAWQYLGLG